ncbi:MAG: hypothetical protein ACTHU0_33160 [Kofleriaceae bacterium]
MNDLLYIVSQGKQLIADGIAHSSLIGMDGGDWADCVDTAWSSTALAVARLPTEKAVLVGEGGEVVTYVGGKSQTEKLTPAPVMIRRAREIAGLVYACGMKRQVYKRIADKKWVAIHAPAAGPTESKGFEDLDGFSDIEIYAVGWGGEIWQYGGTQWSARQSPTDATLTTVCCAPDGVVYAAGRGGVLVRGRGETWQRVAWRDEVSEDLWDLAWYGDRLYVATMSALYTLEDDALAEVSFGEVATPSCYSLSAHDGVLWSVGRDDVASFDGKEWTIYT